MAKIAPNGERRSSTSPLVFPETITQKDFDNGFNYEFPSRDWGVDRVHLRKSKTGFVVMKDITNRFTPVIEEFDNFEDAHSRFVKLFEDTRACDVTGFKGCFQGGRRLSDEEVAEYKSQGWNP